MVTKRQQGINGTAFKGAVKCVASFEGKTVGRVAMAGAGAYPAFFTNHHGHGLIHYLDLQHRFFLALDQGTSGISKGFGVGFNLAHHEAAQGGRATQNLFQLFLLTAQFCQFLFDLDGFQPRQLAQANVQNVIGLPFTQVKTGDQRGFRFITLADDGNHFVDVQQHQLAAFENVNAVQHLGQPMAGAPLNRMLAKADPFSEHLAQAFLYRLAIESDHRQVDGRGGFKAGVRQQRGDELLLFNTAGFGLAHQAHGCVFAGFIPNRIQHRQNGGLGLGLVL